MLDDRLFPVKIHRSSLLIDRPCNQWTAFVTVLFDLVSYWLLEVKQAACYCERGRRFMRFFIAEYWAHCASSHRWPGHDMSSLIMASSDGADIWMAWVPLWFCLLSISWPPTTKVQTAHFSSLLLMCILVHCKFLICRFKWQFWDSLWLGMTSVICNCICILELLFQVFTLVSNSKKKLTRKCVIGNLTIKTYLERMT